MDKLLRKQRDAVRMLRWVLDPMGNRAQGRSYAMACAYLDLAVIHHGCHIVVRDHHPSRQADETLLRLIQALATKRYPRHHFVYSRDSIMCEHSTVHFEREP